MAGEARVPCCRKRPWAAGTEPITSTTAAIHLILSIDRSPSRWRGQGPDVILTRRGPPGFKRELDRCDLCRRSGPRSQGPAPDVILAYAAALWIGGGEGRSTTPRSPTFTLAAG